MASEEVVGVEGLQNACRAEEEPQEQSIAPPVHRHREKPRQVVPFRGGYECEFVQRPPTALQTDCSVCLQVLRSPHLASCCGHNFCKDCIECLQKDCKPCPLCNTDKFALTYNRAHDISLKDFEVYCTYRVLGCEWKGKLEMLDKHLNVDPEPEKQLEGCAFVEVQCCHDGCGQSLQRRVISQHQGEECFQRPFSCDYCHDYNSTKYDVVANHFPACKYYPVPCPNYCTPYSIERQLLEHHLNKNCPLQEVECEFKYAGCQTTVPRKDMPEHLKEDLAGHMTLLARQNQELITKTLEKEETMRRMTEENQQKMKEIEGLLADQKEKLKEKEKQIEQLEKKQSDWAKMERERTTVTEMLKQRMERYDTAKVELEKRVRTLAWQQGTIKRELQQEIHSLTQQQRAIKFRHQESGETVQKHTATIDTLKTQIADLAQMHNTAKRVSELNARVGGLAKQQDVVKEGLEVKVRELEKKVGGLAHIENTVLPLLHGVNHHLQIAPVEFNMRDFERHKGSDDPWYSEGFYTHPHGYKMCLRVGANGVGMGKGTHVSVFVSLVQGEFDDTLKWPFRGGITIQLRNQREDGKHHEHTVVYNDRTPAHVAVPVTSDKAAVKWWGQHMFIPHSELDYDATANRQYLMNDCLCFRVKAQLDSDRRH